MAAIKLNNFGGEFPSTHPRALPANAAQRNESLSPTSTSFKPVRTDLTVATCPAGTKTMHRFARKADGTFNSDPATGWITSTGDRSYVKGQINDERTERTYVFFNDGTQRPRAIDVNGSDRLLGVPVPLKPTVVLQAGEELTRDEAETFLFGPAIESLQKAVIQSTTDPVIYEPATRYTAGSVVLGGPYSTYGLLFSSNGAVPAPQSSNHWSLFGIKTVAQADALGLNRAQLGAVTVGGNVLVPLVALPYTRIPTPAMLLTKLTEVEWGADAGPQAGQPILDSTQATELRDAIMEKLDPSTFAKSERDELDDLVEEFARLLNGAAATPPTKPVEPTKPTVPEYTYFDGP